MAILLSLPLLRGGGGGTPVAQNQTPLRYASNREVNSSSRLISTALTVTRFHFQKCSGSRRRCNFVVNRRSLPPLLCCFSHNGGGGSGSNRRDEKGVEDEDADIEELLARSQRKVVIDVHPLQETRREEEEAVSKGREMLFRHFCLHLGLTPSELRAMWWARGRGPQDEGGAEERLRIVGDFLEEEWGWRYRPLSPRAAAEMLDEYIHMGRSVIDEGAAAAARPPPTTASPPPPPPRLRLRLLPDWWR